MWKGLLFPILLICGCASYNAKTDTYEYPKKGYDEIETNEAKVLAPFAAIYQIAKISSTFSSKEFPHRVSGKCISKDRKRVCRHTYLLVENIQTKTKSRVWIDDSGQFEVNLSAGAKIQLQAIHKKTGRKSKIFSTTVPATLEITMSVEKPTP